MFEEIRSLLRNGFYEKDYLKKTDYVTSDVALEDAENL
jgi:hypothetical protein